VAFHWSNSQGCHWSILLKKAGKMECPMGNSQKFPSRPRGVSKETMRGKPGEKTSIIVVVGIGVVVSSISGCIGRVFGEDLWGLWRHRKWPEVASPKVTWNDFTGSDRKLHHRKLLHRKWRNGKCKGDHFPHHFSHRVFPALFLWKHLALGDATSGHFRWRHNPHKSSPNTRPIQPDILLTTTPMPTTTIMEVKWWQ
jgi:hypothetical protein